MSPKLRRLSQERQIRGEASISIQTYLLQSNQVSQAKVGKTLESTDGEE